MKVSPRNPMHHKGDVFIALVAMQTGARAWRDEKEGFYTFRGADKAAQDAGYAPASKGYVPFCAGYIAAVQADIPGVDDRVPVDSDGFVALEVN